MDAAFLLLLLLPLDIDCAALSEIVLGSLTFNMGNRNSNLLKDGNTVKNAKTDFAQF